MPVTVGGTGFPEPETKQAPPGHAAKAAPPITEETTRAELLKRIADLSAERDVLIAAFNSQEHKAELAARADDAYATAVAAIEFLSEQCSKVAGFMAQTQQHCASLITKLNDAARR